MSKIWEDKTILVTGGTGSLGSTLIRFLLSQEAQPKKVICLSRGWIAQANLRRDLADNPRLRTLIGDVRDLDRLRIALHDVDYVIHTAALKSVRDCDYSPSESLQTNVIGAWNVLSACLESSSVKKALLISTDKSAGANTTYGASKALAEKLFIAWNSYSSNWGCKFSAVRYGNVLGSAGSVVHVFREQAFRGVPLTLTSEQMTRFWISLPDACKFVLRALTDMHGGEVFVPKIKSSTLIDLIQAMFGTYPHILIGPQPSEKIHEVMITDDESRLVRDIGWGYCFEPQKTYWRASSSPWDAYPEAPGEYSSEKSTRMTINELKEMLKDV